MSFNKDIHEINELNNQLNNLKITGIHNLIEKNNLLNTLFDKICDLQYQVRKSKNKSEEDIHYNCKHKMIYEAQEYDKTLYICSICGYIGH